MSIPSSRRGVSTRIAAVALLLQLASVTASAQSGQLVYVPNSGSANVSVYQTNTDGSLLTVGTITVGAGPAGAAVRGDQAFAYVTNSTDDTVSVIATATQTVVQTIATGDGPRGITTSPDGTRLYVANNGGGANSIMVFNIDAVTGQLSAPTTVAIAGQPRDLAISPDGSRVYVANQAGDTVSVLNTSTNAVVATVNVGDTPGGVVVNPAGTRAYVANISDATLSVINTETNTVVATVNLAVGSSPREVAISADGRYVFVGAGGNNTISILDTTTNILTTTSFPDNNSRPMSVVISADGTTLYAADNNNFINQIRAYRIDTSTGALTHLGVLSTGNSPIGIGVCGNGNSMLGSGATFVANTAAALNCAGSTPSFTGGTLRLNTNNLSFGSSMSLGSAGGTVNTNGQTGTITGVLTGTGRLTKLGTGTLTLAGNNTYSGGTTINGGTLRLEHNNALGTGALTVLGSTIDYANGLTVGNAIDLQNNVTLNVTSGSATQGGAITGTFGVIKEGAGTLVLTGANSYTGGTTINAGALIGTTASLPGNITNRATLVFDQAFSGVYGGVLSGTGTLVKSGVGTVVMSGANTYTGATTIAAGTLLMGHAQALGSTSSLRIDARAALDLNGYTLLFNRVEGSGTVALGGGRFTLDGTSTFAGRVGGTGTFVKAGTGTLTLTGANSLSGLTDVQSGTLRAGAANTLSANSTLSVASGATVDLAGFSQSVGALAGTGAVNLAGASLTTGGNGASTTFGGSISGTGSVTKVGAGTWTLTGNNQFTGSTFVAGGTLRIGAAGALGLTSGVTLGGAATLDLNGFDHRFASIGGNGTVALGTAALTLDAGDAFSSLAASVTGAGRLIKSGTGVLSLSGTNTYTGGTTVQAGSVIGTTSSLQNAIVNNGTVAFDQANDGAYTGSMSGSGALVIQGAGTITMTGPQTYTGGTLVAKGRLIGNTTSLRGTVAVDAALTFDQAFDGLFAGQLGGAGSIVKSGTGTLTLAGGHGFSGLTTVTNGTLALNGSLAGSINVQGGALTGNGVVGGSVTIGAGAAAGLAAPQASTASSSAVARESWATAAADAQAALGALGQLTIAGDLTVGPQGTLQGVVTSGGDSTLIAVGGVARLSGVTFDLATQGANHPRVMQTAVLDAARGIVGQANARVNAPNLEAWLTTSGTTMFLTVVNPAVSLASAAGGANGAAAAGALDRMRASATGDLRDVTRELAALGDAQLATALDQVAGEVHGTALQLTAIESEAAADLVRAEATSRRASPQLTIETGRSPAAEPAGAWHRGRRWWGHLLGQRATLDAAGDVRSANGHTGGFAIGLDWTPGRSWMLGAGGGYGLGELTLAGGDAVDSTAPRAFAFAGYGRGRWTAVAGGSVARTTYQTERAMAFTARLDPRFGGTALFGGVDREATAEISGLDTSVWVDGEATARFGSWMAHPGVGVRVARYGRSAWTENGAGALSLSAPDQSISSTQGDLRLRVVRATGRFRPFGEATYRRELGAGLTATAVQFGAGSAAFDVHGLPLAEDRVIGRLGASARTTGGSDVSLGYRGEAGGGQVRHAVDFAVRFQ